MKNMILKGTLLLTIAGILSRIMGFFYRIFLANTIGAEGMGIYQLIFSIYSVCFSLCASGLETAISKLTAEKCESKNAAISTNILNTGLCISLLLSLFCSVTIYFQADFISNTFLKEPRCTELLKILAVTIPFGTLQSCFCGYYFARQKAIVPAIAQLIEQCFRIGCVFLLHRIHLTNQLSITPSIAVIGIVFGEFCSLLFTITCFSFHLSPNKPFSFSLLFYNPKELLSLAAPLSISRIGINLLISLEAAMIPGALRSFGMDNAAALSIYGVLNGMALPFILFPNALTSSISLMLLPDVSKSYANKELNHLKNTIKKTFSFCLLLGCCCLFFFLLFGNFLGKFIYQNSLAGSFITTLAWLCPFLYLNTTLTSVLNGLGKTYLTFFSGIIGLLIRIGFIYFLVPVLGIQGYLYGLLASQLFVTFFGCSALFKILGNSANETYKKAGI